MHSSLIEFRSISRSFGGIHALSDVSIRIEAGECHALVGENGAGKSTLGRILAGIHIPDSGEILLRGRGMKFRSPRDAMREGVAMVHQELAFCPDLSVEENLCLGHYPRHFGVLLDRTEMRNRAHRLLDQVGSDVDPGVRMRTLSTGQEQMVQIASALGTGAQMLVLDEPTSSLSEREAKRLFEVMGDLKKEGVTVIYVSHRMAEIFELCDRATVLRDGSVVNTVKVSETDERELVKMMIGRDLDQSIGESEQCVPGGEALCVRGLSSPGSFDDVNLSLGKGEILGLAGLVGAGRSAVVEALFGLDPVVRGEILVEGEVLTPGSVRRAMRRGMALVPEDRKRQGLILQMGLRENVSLSILDRLRRRGVLNRSLERVVTEELVRELDIRAPSVDMPVIGLSGGNQQKVVLARWLARQARILLVDEPTRGVDVGAKASIHALLRRLAREGVAILLVSSDLPELLALSDRIQVMRDGRMEGEVSRSGASEEMLIQMMAGVSETA